MRIQEPILRQFARYLHADPNSQGGSAASMAALRAGNARQPPRCQPPFLEPPARPLRSTTVASGILLGAFEVDGGRRGIRARDSQMTRHPLIACLRPAVLADLRRELLCVMSLTSKRAAACACSCLCSHIAAHVHAASLAVRIEDATFENAAFVGRLPNLERLHVQGETSLPRGLDLKHLRGRDWITINKLGFEAALFLGAAISGGNHALRLSNNSCVLLASLRTRERINLINRVTSDSDLAALLGALSLNFHLKELNINKLGNPELTHGNGLQAAMVQALPWHLLRHQPGIRVTSLLQACSEQHASSF